MLLHESLLVCNHCLKRTLSKLQARDTTLGFNNDFMNQKLLSHEIDRKWKGVVERVGRSGIMGNLEGWRLSLSHYLRKARMSALPCYSKVSITLCSLWFKQHCFHTGYMVHNKPLKVPNKCEIACDVFSLSLSSLCVLWSCSPMTDPSALSSSPVGIGWA